jgi:hypothetical protein
MQGQLNSLSRIGSRLGISPAAVDRITRELGIVPIVWLDDRPYYSDDAVEAMREHLHPSSKPEAKQPA